MRETISEFSAEREGIVWKATPPNENISDYGKYFYVDPKTGVLLKENMYPRGMITPWHRHSCAHGMYVLDGELMTNKGVYHPGDFLWWPIGSVAEHGATKKDDARVFFMTTGSFDLLYEKGPDARKEEEGLVQYHVNADALDWVEKEDGFGDAYLEKSLLDDEKTGMQVCLRRLRTGWETPWHSCDAARGFYVLKGICKTDRGFYGPGSFVWFPEGCISRLGASRHTDADIIFVSDKKARCQKALDPTGWTVA